MSNAAVINATSTSGQTAGTPISIETGGDVVLKAYGTGSGNWFVVMAFAPVVNGVTGAPVTLTIGYNQPGRQTSAVGTSATEWVGWVLDQGGTWEASGIVEGYQPGEAQSGDLGPFASFEALPKYGVKSGARASVNGVQYTYGAGGWAEAAAGGGLVPYANFAALSAQEPKVGKIAQIPRLCGNGYFALRGNGTRWEVCPGESIIRDAGAASAGYPLIAVSTAFVALASYVIPADLIGDGEQWGSVHFAENTGVLTGTDAYQVRIASNQISCVSNYTFTNRRTTATGNIVRTGSSIICLSAASLSGSDVNNFTGGGLQATNLAASQTISIGITPGAAGNTLKINQWSFRRIA